MKKFITRTCSVVKYRKDGNFPSSDDIIIERRLIQTISNLEISSSKGISVCNTRLIDIFINDITCEKFIAQKNLLYTVDVIKYCEKLPNEDNLHHALRSIFLPVLGYQDCHNTPNEFKESLDEYYLYYKSRIY